MRTIATALLLACAAVTATAAFAADDKDNKCTIATKGNSPTAKGCAAGGRKEAARVMKLMVKTAKANGVKFTCASCHVDMDAYKLTDNARADYDKLVAAQKQ